jgi:DnaJ-class molecular chaperone
MTAIPLTSEWRPIASSEHSVIWELPGVKCSVCEGTGYRNYNKCYACWGLGRVTISRTLPHGVSPLEEVPA